MQDLALTEEESYEKRLALGGMIGEGYALLLNDVNGLQLNPEKMKYCHFTGRAAMTLDDLRDGDTEFTEDQLREFLDLELSHLESTGKAGVATSSLASQYSRFSDLYRLYLSLSG